MTKREAYFKDDITPNQAYKLLCEFINYYRQKEDYNEFDEELAWDFLNQSVNPELSKDEKIILENLNAKFQYLTLYNGKVCALEIKDRDDGGDEKYYLHLDYPELFKFIHSGDKYLISDLLD